MKNSFSSDSNTEKPLVSILCPAYNAEKFIENTINSILDQDYENLELVISDDCSKDGTVDEIKRLSKLHPGKIILNINDVNLGITNNCNVTLNLCRGKYIAFFAGDDLMYPSKISAQVSAMEAEPDSSMSYHSVNILDGDNNNNVLFTTEKNKQSYLSFLDVIKKGGIIGACSIMARRDCIPTYGFSTQFPSVSDWLMHIEIALRGKILKVDGIYGGYTRHNKGASRKTFETLGEIKGTLDFINTRYNHSIELLKATKKAYRRYILGELARLFIAGDTERLKILNRDFLNNMPGSKAISLILQRLVYLHIHKAKITKYFFNLLSSSLK